MYKRNLRALYGGVSHSPFLMSVDDGADDDDKGGGGGEDDKDKAVDPTEHARLAAAHERLKKDAKADRDELKDLKARLDAIQADRDKAEEDKAEQDKDVQALRTQLESKHGREIKAKDDEIAKLKGQLNTLVIDNGLSRELDGVKVSAEFKDAVTALLRQGVEIKDEDGVPTAFKGGLPLADAVKLWAESDQGKAFVRLDNSGGDAKGGDRKTKDSGEINPWKAETLNRFQQGQILQADPEKAKRLRAEAGIKDAA